VKEKEAEKEKGEEFRRRRKEADLPCQRDPTAPLSFPSLYLKEKEVGKKKEEEREEEKEEEKEEEEEDKEKEKEV